MDFGAVNTQTLQYVLPNKANKSYEYKCPDCDKDLILCRGKIRNPYFRHKVDKKDPCKYYTNPTETQIHKDAKLRLTELIKTNKLKLNRYCDNCKKTKHYFIPKMCEKSKICIEYKFQYNESNKFADVAYLNDDKIIQIYEICQTHKTKENDRPEPWFEFNALDIMELFKKEDNDLEINCVRDKNCDECIYMENLKMNDFEKWIRIKLGQDYKNPKYESSSKGDYSPCHKRLWFDAQVDQDESKNNKDICDIFADDLNTNRIVVYSWKGKIHGYVISNKDYNNYNYWDMDKIGSDGVNGDLKLPYIYEKDYGCSDNGTVDILKDLISKSIKISPNNGCKYASSEYKFSVKNNNYCNACNNTGTSYWSDGVNGPCMLCDRGD